MHTIQILSDLHLESPKAYDVYEIVPRAPYLALLGDIGNVIPHKKELLGFLTRLLKCFRAVLFVPGNHEAYRATWSEALAVLSSFEQDLVQRHDKVNDASSITRLGQFVVLNREVFRVPTDDSVHLVILGCSLFSYIPPHREMAVEMGLQDFYQTTSWDTHAHNDVHKQDLDWLNGQVEELQRGNDNVKILILTHWSPTTDPRSMDPKHLGSPIMAGFATDLSDQNCFKSDKVVMWAFGHTHFNCDFTIERENAGPLRLLTNQRGYYSAQATGFDGEKVVELLG